MRVLGPRTSLAVFRWDLIYLAAQLAADERPGVAALAAPVQLAITKHGDRRAAFEQAQDGVIVALALLNKRDTKRDGLIVQLGGVARATYKQIYAVLFPKRSPNETAKLGVDAESGEIKRILGELAALPAGHPLQAAYAADLDVAEQGLVVAKSSLDEAKVKLALQRSEIERFKLELDQLRLATHGQLLALLQDKAEADAFFRPANVTAGEEKAEPEPAQPAPTPAGNG